MKDRVHYNGSLDLNPRRRATKKATLRPWVAALPAERPADIQRVGHPSVIAHVYGYSGGRPIPKEANARLIVSAVNAYDAHKAVAVAARLVLDRGNNADRKQLREALEELRGTRLAVDTKGKTCKP